MIDRRRGKYLSDLILSSFFRKSRVATIIDSTIVTLLALLLLFVPLPFGSVQSLPIFVIECVSVLCFALWMLKFRFFSDSQQLQEFRNAYEELSLARNRSPFLVRYPVIAKSLRILTLRRYPQKYEAVDLVEVRDPLESPYLSFLGYPVRKTGLEFGVLVFLCLNLLQMIPLPLFLISLISPSTAALYKSAQIHLSRSFGTLSLDPIATLGKMCEYVAYFLLFLVAVNTLYKRKFVWAILLALICSATFQSIYGLYESFTHEGFIFGYRKPFWIEIASGTFINPNHYASYLAILIVLILSISLKLKSQLALNSRTMLRRILLFLNSKLLLCFSIIVLGFVAVVYSRSRSGLFLTGLSMCAFLIVYFYKMPNRSRRLISLTAISTVVVLMVLIMAGPLHQRFQHLGSDLAQSSGRTQVWLDTIRIFVDFPLTGIGTGTFHEIFPKYQTVVQTVYSHAHNDYLQLIAETGVFSILLSLMIFFAIARRASILMSRNPEGFAIVQVGAFFSLVVAFFSSMIHFSFQIPALCVTTVLVAAIFFVKYERRKRRTTES